MDDDVEVVRDRRRDFGDEVVRIRVLRVPESEKFPEGIKYAFHYGRMDGDDPILRYDWWRSIFREPKHCSGGSFANSPITFLPDP